MMCYASSVTIVLADGREMIFEGKTQIIEHTGWIQVVIPLPKNSEGVCFDNRDQGVR